MSTYILQYVLLANVIETCKDKLVLSQSFNAIMSVFNFFKFCVSWKLSALVADFSKNYDKINNVKSIILRTIALLIILIKDQLDKSTKYYVVEFQRYDTIQTSFHVTIFLKAWLTFELGVAPLSDFVWSLLSNES